MIPPQTSEAFIQNETTLLGSTPRHPSNGSSFSEGQTLWLVYVPASKSIP
jgi:hypothetical protein